MDGRLTLYVCLWMVYPPLSYKSVDSHYFSLEGGVCIQSGASDSIPRVDGYVYVYNRSDTAVDESSDGFKS